MQDKFSRLPRVERDEVVEVHEDENAHLWAVSYSDFLMALLAFFILFFSFEGDKRENIILNLASQFEKGGGAAGGASKAGASSSDGHGVSASHGQNDFSSTSPVKKIKPHLPKGIAESIKDFKTQVDLKNETLTVLLPDDLFKAGKFKVSSDKQKQVEDFFKLVKQYDGKVVLNIEGHTDSQPLKIHKTDVITDNFVLSSLRATSALNIARQVGLNEKFLFARAGSSNSRDSRSLSIRIEAIKEIR